MGPLELGGALPKRLSDDAAAASRDDDDGDDDDVRRLREDVFRDVSIHDIFTVCDCDLDGLLSTREELAEALAYLGVYPSEEELLRVQQQFGRRPHPHPHPHPRRRSSSSPSSSSFRSTAVAAAVAAAAAVDEAGLSRYAASLVERKKANLNP